MNDHVTISQHPLILHKLSHLRDKDTPPAHFRRLVYELAQLLFAEASKDLEVTLSTVQTPMGECPCCQLKNQIGLIPILRAGLGMSEAILELLPEAQVWHLGLYRDHATLEPVTYYNKLPPDVRAEICFIVDPMLATGGSAVAAVDILKKWGTKQIRFLGLIAAPEGVKHLQESHPDVPIHLAALDSHLNEVGYIVPGLGDAGDRQFGT